MGGVGLLEPRGRGYAPPIVMSGLERVMLDVVCLCAEWCSACRAWRPDWDVAADLDSGALVRVLPNHAQPADVMAVTTTRSASSAKIRHTVEFLVAQLREGPYSLRAKGP